MGFSHVFSPECLNNTLLTQGCVLERYLNVGRVDKTHIPRTGQGVRSLWLSLQVSWWLHSLNHLLQRYSFYFANTDHSHCSNKHLPSRIVQLQIVVAFVASSVNGKRNFMFTVLVCTLFALA